MPRVYRKLIVGYAQNRHGADALALARLLASAGPVEEVLIVEAEHGSGEKARDAALRRLEPLASSGWPSGVRVSPHVVSGESPVEALSSTADREGADLLVLGTSHRGFAARMLMGTTAGAIFPDAHWPVVIAPLDYADGSPSLRTIGVALDRSSESRPALDWAIAVATAFSAELRLISVVEPPPAPVETWGASVPGSTWDAGFSAQQSLEAVEVMREGTRRELEAAQAIAGKDRAETVVIVGDARTELREVAADLDMLVVGSHGEGRVLGAMTRSVTRGLAHSSPVPLAVVPPTIREAPDSAVPATARPA
jgi:nucleotide-binding universal stress UspA family protein